MQIHGRYKEHSGLLKTKVIQDKFLPLFVVIFFKRNTSVKTYINTFSDQYNLQENRR